MKTKSEMQEVIEQYHKQYEIARAEAKRDISRAFFLAEASVALAKAYKEDEKLDSALGFYNKARAAYLVAAGIDRRYYRQVAKIDSVLIELLMSKRNTETTTKYIIEQRQKELEWIQKSFSKYGKG